MPRVLLLHTGGTLGMRGTPLEPDAYNSTLTDAVPEIAQIADLEARIVYNLDSSDMGPAHWRELARVIAAERERYDGFVVVHGTDTMAYTASALSYALRNIDRPVVLTGAQRPLAELRSDARRNLADAVTLATTDIAEVGICFDGLFLRGCRSSKVNAHDYRAFDSPACEPLARMGVNIARGLHVRRPQAPFTCLPDFCPHVLVLHATPGMDAALLELLVRNAQQASQDAPETRVRGIVLAAFGVGTVPAGPQGLPRVLGQAVEAGIDVVVVSQSTGVVDLGLYPNSRALSEAGAICGQGMRVEAAVTKLMHALALHPEQAQRRAYLQADVAGEMGVAAE